MRSLVPSVEDAQKTPPNFFVTFLPTVAHRPYPLLSEVRFRIAARMQTHVHKKKIFAKPTKVTYAATIAATKIVSCDRIQHLLLPVILEQILRAREERANPTLLPPATSAKVLPSLHDRP